MGQITEIFQRKKAGLNWNSHRRSRISWTWQGRWSSRSVDSHRTGRLVVLFFCGDDRVKER